MKLRLLAMLVLGAVAASAATDAEERLGNAAEALKEVMGIPDRSIPQELLAKAECVVIVPNLKKGAFLIGGQYGKGFATCRNPNGDIDFWRLGPGSAVSGHMAAFALGFGPGRGLVRMGTMASVVRIVGQYFCPCRFKPDFKFGGRFG
mgnify:CR=1 FL=1